MAKLATALGLWACLLLSTGCSQSSRQAAEAAILSHQQRPAAPSTPAPTASPAVEDDDLQWNTLAVGGAQPSASPAPARRSPRGESVADADLTWLALLGRAADRQPPERSAQRGDETRWLALADRLDGPTPTGASRIPPSEQPYRRRRGPAHPGDIWATFKQDARELPGALWDDTKAIARAPTAWVLLGLAGAAGIAVNGSKLDREVGEHYLHHGGDLSKCLDNLGDVGGNPGLHFAIAGAMYFHGQAAGNVKEYETSKTLLNALAINGLVTLALKGMARTESPNGDEFGWPSGHTSSTFCFATVMHKSYGPWVGVPLFAFAAFVGYERVDARNHDLSDVISGALIGIAVGHLVCENHQQKIFGMDVVGFAPSQGGVGIALSKRW